MKFQQFDMLGVGRSIQIHFFIGDEPSPDTSRQWFEGTVEVPVVGVMDEDALRTTAMTILRDALNAEIAALRSGQFG
jgi:phosphoribosylaminoimidazole-succinocarboxamide synthase